MRRFYIGIDLGTTNCALAFLPIDEPGATVEALPVVQALSFGKTETSFTLPSFLYLPPEGERTADSPDAWIAGLWARRRLAETPGRVVASAKSWLAHHTADRRAPFLPLEGNTLALEARISPLEASAKLLAALARAWDQAHPDAPLREQSVAITVPASFDPLAQQLTLEAAAQTCLYPDDLSLLEEPQAAFYAWMDEASKQPESAIEQKGTTHLLVFDIGGGTTDLSLFRLNPGDQSTEAKMERVAVSEHLLLGGDNLDLALAHHLESQLSPEEPLDAATFAQLVAAARGVKEAALGEEASASETCWPVAVARPGRGLIGGTLRTEIDAPSIHKLLLDGYFPNIKAEEFPLKTATGLREMGLPYAKDAGITRHLAAFLHQRPAVDAILFNGGVTQAPLIRSRILENLSRWQEGRAPRLLHNPNPNLAVAKGAARYAEQIASGVSTRIEAGAAHSHYLEIEGNRLLCVLPMGTANEHTVITRHANLRVRIGKVVRFPLRLHPRRSDDAPGAILRPDDSEWIELPSLETRLRPLDDQGTADTQLLPVELHSRIRSTGLLQIELHARSNDGQALIWPLEFTLRGGGTSSPRGSTSKSSSTDLLPQKDLDAAIRSLLRTFSKGGEKKRRLTANTLFTSLEKSLKVPRSQWSGTLSREIFDSWQGAAKDRAKSPAHEEVWLQVAGFLLRPGCGLPGDEERTETLAEIVARPLIHKKTGVTLQRWIVARRIAPGCTPASASPIWAQASQEMETSELPNAEVALLAGSLETLPLETRAGLSRKMIEAIQKQPAQVAYWKALGRLLSRVLLHGGAEQVLPPEIAEDAWTALHKIKIEPGWQHEAAECWLRAARMTGLRALDLKRATRRSIAASLKKSGLAANRLHVVENVIPLVAQDQAWLLGEQPPKGLNLL